MSRKMNTEDNIEDNKAPCEGCPQYDKCPSCVASGSKECKSILKGG